jgi:hypothetical protein
MKLADQKKGLVLVVLLFFTSSLIYFGHLYSSQSRSVQVDSEYLSDVQSFFDATNSTAYNPFDCACQNQDDTTSNEETEAEEAEVAEQVASNDHIEIPDTLPPPPKALMDKINNNLVQEKVLIVATANYGMRDHVYNWIESLKRTNEEKFLIFCLDEQLYEHLKLAGYGDKASQIPDSWFHTQVEAGFEDYYSTKYRAITHSKTLVVQRLLYLDINVLFSDVDIVWTKPRMVEYVDTFLNIRKETEVLFQQEGFDQKIINSGFYLMRPTDNMKRMLAETIQIQDTEDNVTQQGAMNKALNSLNMDVRTSSVVLLDVLHFPNGFVYFHHDLPNKHGIEPFIVHANYLVTLNFISLV